MAEPQHITLRELQQLVKRTLDERFALPLWVSAEIAEIKVNYSGHCYLDLVEKGGENGVPTAQARAVIWRSHYGRIAACFEAETGQRLAAGLQILARVLVNYHELYGFSLQITDIDPSYTLGDMERQRQQTILRLQQEGVWEMNRQLSAPDAIQRIAVVSSVQAAGYRDFCKELECSPWHFRTTLFDAFMQGAAAEESIIGALCAVAERAEEFDAVVVIRGGGAASDLNCFNAYRLCNHIAQFPLPVITGIGHDKDVSVADMVAYRSLKTPTAVAGWLAEELEQRWSDFQLAALKLHDTVRGRTHAAELRIERLTAELKRLGSERLAQERFLTEQLPGRLRDTVRERLNREGMYLDSAGEVVAAHTPERLLKLGFALLHSGGRSIVSAGSVRPGEDLGIELADGIITAKVTDTKIWQKRQ